MHLQIFKLNAEIISCVKTAYQKLLLFRVFDNVDSGEKMFYIVDILPAMKWVREDLTDMTTKTILNCCRHCFQISDSIQLVVQTVQWDPRHTLITAATDHQVLFLRVGIEILLNLEGEDECTEIVVVESLSLTSYVADEMGLSEEAYNCAENNSASSMLKEEVNKLSFAA